MHETGSRHLVLIVGGAVSGAEAAYQLAERNVLGIVLEQNIHPYGKIADGLPRWHTKLRAQEMRKIDAKLSHPRIHFVPKTKLGRDLSLEEIMGWGVSGVILANGAWKDRPMPIAGIDRFIGHGFFYQNPFVYWFNHYHERDYAGPCIEPADGALVVGGGLASLDCVKILMFETVTRALAMRRHLVSLEELETQGIPKVLAGCGLTRLDLGLQGCTLIYRRKAEDMPLAEPKGESTPEQIERARATRIKLLRNFMAKFQFQFQDHTVPVDFIERNHQFAGLRLATAATENERVKIVQGSDRDFNAPLVVSSIGSMPEPIAGIPMQGTLYHVRDNATGELLGLPGVFAIGNAVTGKGNILASARHGRAVSQHILENYLMGTASGYEEVIEDAGAAARSRVGVVLNRIAGRPPMSPEAVGEILDRVNRLQSRVNYPGDYAAWRARYQDES